MTMVMLHPWSRKEWIQLSKHTEQWGGSRQQAGRKCLLNYNIMILLHIITNMINNIVIL